MAVVHVATVTDVNLTQRAQYRMPRNGRLPLRQPRSRQAGELRHARPRAEAAAARLRTKKKVAKTRTKTKAAAAAAKK